MKQIVSKRKIDSWDSVKEKIAEITENAPDQTTSLSLPYGLQKAYMISHPEPVRLLLHPSMNEYDTFVTHHGKAKKYYLNLWTVNHKASAHTKMVKQQKIQLSYQIKHIIYVPTHRCFVSFAIDLSLRVLATINFTEMSCVYTSHSVLCLFYNACRDDILAGCLGFVMIWKFPQAQNGGLVATQKIDCPCISPEYWVTWIKVDKPSHQLLLNCEEAIVMLDENTYKLRQCFKINFRHKLPFSACVFYHPSSYFITGSKDYSIKVWKTSLKQCPLVTTFNGHCNAITALEVDNANHLVISSSGDKTIRIWCLETFAQTYCLETGEEVQRMEMMTSQRLFYQSEEYIRVWNLNNFHKLFIHLGFEIETSRRVKSSGRPTRLLLQGQDGAIRIVSPTDGTIITTMFPLEKVSDTIVDYAYCPVEERLYTVLSTGGILVFSSSTNPCSAYALWKSDHKVGCVAMIEVKAKNTVEYHRLLFAGLENGQIILANSNELIMNDIIEAHYGCVELLRASENWKQHAHCAPESGYLVSTGADFTLKIWKVVLESFKMVSLELGCVVTLQSVPRDMLMIGNTVGLILGTNALMTYRINATATVGSKNKKYHRYSVVNLDDYHIDIFQSVTEERHSKSISGFSACPTLDIFATSSYDWSVKIWNSEAKLVKEICFDESLRGVCFANPRGDLLVGFQSHISIVPLTNYLPLNFLEMLSSMQFPDDVLEDTVSFDRISSFSYDPDVTPCWPLDLYLRRRVVKGNEEPPRIKIPLKIASAMVAVETMTQSHYNDDVIAVKEPPTRRYSTTQEQQELDEKLRRLQRSSLSRRSSAVQSPLLEAVIARITQSFSSSSDLTKRNSQVSSPSTLAEQLRKLFEDEDKIPDDYWPCAPDGFIPNSVVRMRVPPKKIPAHLMPRILRGEELKEWLKRGSQEEESIPDDTFSQISIDDDFGSFSLFDGYVAPVISPEVKTEEEEEEVTDEELELTKRWKGTLRTTFDKENMMSVYKSRQQMKERKKVSRKPGMPVIAAEEEDEEEEEQKDVKTLAKKVKHKDETIEEEPGKGQGSTLPSVLQNLVNQPWFSGDISGLSAEEIYEEIMGIMSNCSPLTYQKLCSQIADIHEILDLPDAVKQKALEFITNNLTNDSATIRRASLRTVQELNIKTLHAIGGIVSCLNHKSTDLQKGAIQALDHLLGIRDKEALRELFVTLRIITPTQEEPPKREILVTTVRTATMINDWLKYSRVRQKKKKTKQSRTIEKPEAERAVLSKLKLYKKSPPGFPTALTCQSIPSPHDEGFDPNVAMQYTNNFTIQELKKSDLGYKLLSRIGYTKQPSDGDEDDGELYEIHGHCLAELETGIKGLASRKIGHEIKSSTPPDLKNIPEIQVSPVSTMTKVSERKSLDDRDQHLVLPKILHCFKSFRVNNNIRGYERRDSDLRAKEMHYYPRLPRIRRVSELETEVDREDIPSKLEKSSARVRPGRRLKLRENEATINAKERTSILKDLRWRRALRDQEQQKQSRASSAAAQTVVSRPSTGTQSRKGTLLGDDEDESSHETYTSKVKILEKDSKAVPNRASITNDIRRYPDSRTGQPVTQYLYMYRGSDDSDVIGERLSRAVAVNMDKTGTSFVHKLPSGTGLERCGRSRYGILEVFWTTMDADKHERSLRGDKTKPMGRVEAQHKVLRQDKRIPINLHLKPIKNRNLVTNPYTNKKSLFQELKRLEKARKDQLLSEQSRDFVAHKNSPQSLEEIKEAETWGTRELFEL